MTFISIIISRIDACGIRQRLFVHMRIRFICTFSLLSLPRINFTEEFSVLIRGTFLLSSTECGTNRVKRASHGNHGCDSRFSWRRRRSTSVAVK